MSDSKTTAKKESWSFEKKEYTGILTFINMPRNFLTPEVLIELGKKLDTIEQDLELRVLVIRSGIAGVFMSSVDINNFHKNPAEVKKIESLTACVLQRIEKLSIPVISAIDGYCLGVGLEFALASDISVATSTSRFGQPEILYGLMPGSQRISRLSQCLTKGQIKMLLLTGFSLNAEDAFQMGLVGEVVVQGKLDRKVEKITERISSVSSFAVKSIKKSVNVHYQKEKNEDIEQECRV